jgi:hypothetical protein
VVALRDRGYPVEYLLIPDEGHGFARPVNNMAALMAMEQFFAHYLGGRYQQGGTPEVVAKLKEITVDPKTVVLAKKVDANSVGAPKPAADLQPGTWKYKAKLAANGQEIPLEITTVIKDGGNQWTATDTMQTPMGEATDVALLEKGTLLLKKRDVQQGPMTAKLAFAGNKASGTMGMNGNEKPVDVALTGPLFADAAGSMQSIAALPLAEGYSTQFRNFDMRKQKEKLMQLKVVGMESVTVPAGTFDSYKVEITSADGGNDTQTLWIAKDSRKPVKMSAVLGSMGGATMTAELEQ